MEKFKITKCKNLVLACKQTFKCEIYRNWSYLKSPGKMSIIFSRMDPTALNKCASPMENKRERVSWNPMNPMNHKNPKKL